MWKVYKYVVAKYKFTRNINKSEGAKFGVFLEEVVGSLIGEWTFKSNGSEVFSLFSLTGGYCRWQGKQLRLDGWIRQDVSTGLSLTTSPLVKVSWST